MNFDPYTEIALDGRERDYVEAMRAAARPGLVDALVEQIDAFAAAARKHYEASGEEGDECESLATRCVDNARVWLDYAVMAAVREAYCRAAQAPEPDAWREVAVIPTRNDRTHEQTALDAYQRAATDLGGTLAEAHGTDARAVCWAQALDPVTGARLGEVEIVADMQRSALVVRVRRCEVER